MLSFVAARQLDPALHSDARQMWIADIETND
jgi:hypothetical protein